MLLVGGHAEDISWYRARLFETVATLMIIFVLLYDVFMLYRDSHLKYQQSYQNSIRDPLTRLYNRSYFYESLNQALDMRNPAARFRLSSAISIASSASTITMATFRGQSLAVCRQSADGFRAPAGHRGANRR
jgi:hypothetical protein